MIKKILAILILCILIWAFWSSIGRDHEIPSPNAMITEIENINPSDTLNRSIVGIQPYMVTTDYLSQEVFKEKLGLYLKEAKNKGMIRENSVALFPEYIGTWLIVEGEKFSVAEEKTINGAMTTLVASNPISFAKSFFSVGEAKDKAAAALFRMKATKMAESYFKTFSELAQEYKTYIAAGSIILPGPEVVDGSIVLDAEKPLYNVSFIFGPDGKIVGKPILKVFPIESEQPILAASSPQQIPTFDLPIGKTALLICADSWFPESYQTATEEQAEVILVPSYCTGYDAMSKIWQGYSGYPEPAETDLTDIGKLNEGQAWEKYALPGKIKTTSAKIGMNVFLRGDLWDLGTDGQPLIVLNDSLLAIKPSEKGGIWSLNF